MYMYRPKYSELLLGQFLARMRPTLSQVKMAAGSVDDPNLLDLPLELVEALVLAPALTIPDICAFSQVCWSLNHVVSRIWSKIAKSR